MTSCLGQTTLKDEKDSLTGKYKAELIEGDTGAVGGWMFTVRISEMKPSIWDRLLHREAETVFAGDLRSTRVKFAWKGDNHLEITCNGCEANKIQVQETAWRDVTVSYEIGR